MNILNQLIKHIEGHIQNIYMKNELHVIPDSITLIDGNTPVRPASICIGTQRDIFYTIKNYTIPKNTVFFTPVSASTKTYSNLNVNLIETTLPLVPLYNKLSNTMTALSKAAGQSYLNETGFDIFFHEIVSMDLSHDDEIKARLYELPFHSGDAYNIIVLATSNAAKLKNSYDDVKKEVLKVLPTSNITFYSNRMVIMYHSPGRSVRFPEEKINGLADILEKYDAYAGISNHTLNFEMIRTEYIIAKNILNISKRMFGNKHGRIYTQEEYGMFYTLDLCYKQFEQTFHHNNILYLAHPGLSALIRYDDEHNTNLREILLCYLMNDRSLSKTSKLLFMHRNTTLNKVNKILEIVEDNLDDPAIRQRLLFSCMLYDYCEKYKQKTFKLLPLGSSDADTDRS